MLSAAVSIDKAAASPPAPVDLAPLVAEIRRSNDLVLEAVRERGHERTQPIGDRAAATLDPELLERLVAAVETTNTLLRQGGEHGRRLPPSLAALKGAGFPSRDALFARMLQANSEPDGRTKFASEVHQLHALWTRDELFERYGLPDFMAANERGLQVKYTQSNESGHLSNITFTTADGLVAQEWFD